MAVMFVDNFSSGIDDLPAKKQGDPAEVLRVLEQCKRFSVFEATATQRIAKTMDYIFKAELVRATGSAFPWTRVELTDKGRELIAANTAQEKNQ